MFQAAMMLTPSGHSLATPVLKLATHLSPIATLILIHVQVTPGNTEAPPQTLTCTTLQGYIQREGPMTAEPYD